MTRNKRTATAASLPAFPPIGNYHSEKEPRRAWVLVDAGAIPATGWCSSHRHLQWRLSKTTRTIMQKIGVSCSCSINENSTSGQCQWRGYYIKPRPSCCQKWRPSKNGKRTCLQLIIDIAVFVYIPLLSLCGEVVSLGRGRGT